jgi:hypothetical protein
MPQSTPFTVQLIASAWADLLELSPPVCQQLAKTYQIKGHNPSAFSSGKITNQIDFEQHY